MTAVPKPFSGSVCLSGSKSEPLHRGRMRFQRYRKFRGSHPTLASHVPHVTHVRFISGPRMWACGVALILTPCLRGLGSGQGLRKAPLQSHVLPAVAYRPKSWPWPRPQGTGRAGEPASSCLQPPAHSVAAAARSVRAGARRPPPAPRPGQGCLPKVHGPDVLLDAGRRAQHLPAVLPEAFEHHLHGVLDGRKAALKRKPAGLSVLPFCRPDAFSPCFYSTHT